MRPSVSACLALALVAWSVPAGSQVQISSEERFFRIEWHVERAGGRDVAIVGALANHYLYPLEWVELKAQVFDGAGQLTHETLATVTRVPAGGRGSFRLQLPDAGARYSVTVHAFEFGLRESP